jgi:hypothetical protein
MKDRRVSSKLFGLGILAAAAWPAYLLVVRRWHARWGATDEEVARRMPGDDVVKGARDVTTRGVTIKARPEEIWPWLVQMGYQRGGMYSYDWIDQLMGILDRPSADQILSEFQHLEVGDVIPMGSGPSWPVKAIEPFRSLVLDIRDRGVHITWSLGLYELDEAHTRLVLRIRVRLALIAQVFSLFPVSDLGQFLMVRRMLLGIKERAEALARQQRNQTGST